MSPKNRGDRIQLLAKVVTKNFTPVLAPTDRSLLEHLLYACCLEDAPYEAADEAFHRLQESFFDWNEVRVTTVTELMEHLKNLPDAKTAALRVKKNLQSIFETRYSFDLQDMIKMNQGKAIAELEKLGGMTRFALAYVTQNALGGHAIPVSNTIMQVLVATEIVSESEAAKGHTPGLDRSIPKTKGLDFSSCLHQFGLLVAKSPRGKQTLAILKEAGSSGVKPASKRTVETDSTKKAQAEKLAASPDAPPAEKPKPTSPAGSSKKHASKPPAIKKSSGKASDAKRSTKKEASPKPGKQTSDSKSASKKRKPK